MWPLIFVPQTINHTPGHRTNEVFLTSKMGLFILRSFRPALTLYGAGAIPVTLTSRPQLLNQAHYFTENPKKHSVATSRSHGSLGNPRTTLHHRGHLWRTAWDSLNSKTAIQECNQPDRRPWRGCDLHYWTIWDEMKLQPWCDSEWVTADITPAPADRPEVSNNLQLSPEQWLSGVLSPHSLGMGVPKSLILSGSS